MKKVFLMGKANDVAKNLNDFLQKHFRVQLAFENSNNVDSLIKLVEPDLVIILLIGMFEQGGGLFDLLSNKYKNIPVITIGTRSEYANFEKYCRSDQFTNLERPIDNELVLEAINRILALSGEKLVKEEASSGLKNVLLVDDDALVLRSIKNILDGYYDVSLANSGMKAMTSIGKKRPDLILLDYEMPVCDGKQTLEMIKADEEIKDIPVVFLTGVNDRDHIEAVLKLMPSAYLLKPVSQDKLLKTIGKIIGS